MPIPALKGILKKLQAKGDKTTTMYNLETTWDQAKKDAAAKFKMNLPKYGDKVPSQYWGMVMFLVKQHYRLNESLGDIPRDDYPYEYDEPIEYSNEVVLDDPMVVPDIAPVPGNQALYSLACTLFWARDKAHSLHLASRSFSEHVALNEFYVELTSLTDELVETMQGKYGICHEIIPTPLSDSGIVDFIRLLCRTVEDAQSTITDSFLSNIIDEILALTYRTKYKLEMKL